jgi:hypothetical protein
MPWRGINSQSTRKAWVLQLEGRIMPVLEVKTIEPAARSPGGAGSYLSVTERQIYFLIADGVLIAKRSGARTLVDFQSVKKYYEGLPFKTVSASIPNAPQCARSVPAPRRKRRA